MATPIHFIQNQGVFGLCGEKKRNAVSDETVVIEPPPTQLLVIIGDDTHSFDPSAHLVVVGIGDDGTIQIAPDTLPGAHVRLRKAGAYWSGQVSSHEILVDGQQRSSFSVVAPVTCRFPGNNRSVTFLTESHRRGQTTEVDPGTLRAGLAAAQRSDDHEVTLRGLDRPQSDDATWPADDVLVGLERAYGWPIGTFARIRNDQESLEVTAVDNNDARHPMVDKDLVPLMASAAQLALRAILLRIDTLPGSDNAELPSQAKVISEDLRRVDELCRRAAQNSPGVPEFLGVLSRARRAYQQVMLLAAQSPGAYLGQRLYAARQHGRLTVEEIAAAAAVPADAVTAAEVGGKIAPADEAALTNLLNHLAP